MDNSPPPSKLTKKDASGKITQLGLGSANDSTTLTTLGYAFGGSWDGEDGPTPRKTAISRPCSGTRTT